MSDAQRAYEAAEKRIAEAKARGATELRFDREETYALQVLPPGIAELTGLQILNLDNTDISDLTPLAGLTALLWLGLNRTRVQDLSALTGLTNIHDLRLDGTAIADLRPVRGLRKLAQPPDAPGLTFEDCAAARRDERIAGGGAGAGRSVSRGRAGRVTGGLCLD
ncbi:MAG: leucine-rich repeat domain-containing protein, partial [Rhodobacteraceae bacterium]|nr:leucine-rich repeat domain-containing protein [Paracoccaceae bacterium]